MVQIQQVLKQQIHLGWDQFVQGCIATHWQQIQSTYFEELKVRQAGQKWMSLLIMIVWDFNWTLWDHGNDVLHKNSDVHNELLDMAAMNFAIIEEWHAGGEELILMDFELDPLHAKCSQFC
jgi:hypothetical protein